MVHIITDTTSCLTPEFSKRYDVPIIPQVINIGNDSYLEGIDIDIDTFLKRLTTTAELPKTAAPPPELFVQEFKRRVPTGEPIICIHPSSEVSGTVRSATVAAQDFPGADIRIIDTRLVASPLGTLVKLATGWAEAGESADEIVTRVTQMARRCRLYFMVDTLEFLARGGRIGRAAYLLGSLVNVRPVLIINKEGLAGPIASLRSEARAMERIVDYVAAQTAGCRRLTLAVMDTDSPRKADRLLAMALEKVHPAEVLRTEFTPVMGVHTGPGLIGLGYYYE